MAASDASPFPIKNQAFRVTFPLFDNDGDLVTGAASLDSEVSKDGGTFADCTNEATEIATASGIYYLDLTATEMNADTVAVIVKTTTTDAKTTPLVLYPVTLSEAMLGVNVEEWSEGDVATVEGKIDTIDTVVDAIKLKTDNLPADPASETNVDANETKIDIIDTVVDAIKVKTDALPADPASETNVDANEAKIDIVDANVDAIKLKTDNLPADPASETNVDANEAKIDLIKAKTDNLPVDPASESNVDATEVKVDTIGTDVNTLLARLTAARALLLDQLDETTAGTAAYRVAKLAIALINKLVITEANGNVEQFDDSDVSIGTITSGFTSDGTTTTRKRQVQ